MKSAGMSNPLAIAAASQFATSKQGQKTIGQTVDALKILAIGVGVYFAGKWGYSQFKKVRARNYANENIGHPNLIVASIIYGSFTRFKFNNPVLDWIVGEIDISTDEATLYKLAGQITDIKGVADAYKILFDRNLQEDINKGLDNEELQRFWKIFTSPAINKNTNMYGIGLDLYQAEKGKVTRVNQAEQINGKWQGTNKSYGNFTNGELIGKVVANGIWTHENGQKENYYIVEDCNWFGFNCENGVVLQHQITDIKN